MCSPPRVVCRQLPLTPSQSRSTHLPRDLSFEKASLACSLAGFQLDIDLCPPLLHDCPYLAGALVMERARYVMTKLLEATLVSHDRNVFQMIVSEGL